MMDISEKPLKRTSSFLRQPWLLTNASTFPLSLFRSNIEAPENFFLIFPPSFFVKRSRTRWRDSVPTFSNPWTIFFSRLAILAFKSPRTVRLFILRRQRRRAFSQVKSRFGELLAGSIGAGESFLLERAYINKHFFVPGREGADCYLSGPRPI